MKGLDLASPLDEKARDLAIAYFELDRRSIANAARVLGVNRDTVTRRLQRAHRNGWVTLGDSPLQAGDNTLARVCLRRIFWTEDYWSALPEWDGDTSRPVF